MISALNRVWIPDQALCLGSAPAICADTPDDELMGVRGALEDVGVVAIQATLQLDDGCPCGRELNPVVVAVRVTCGFPVGDELPILHVVEDVLNQLALLSHRGRELAPEALNCAPEEAAVIELLFVKVMPAESVRLCFQRVREFHDLFAESCCCAGTG